MSRETQLVIDFAKVKRGDVGLVGGKNASLGEMIGALEPKGILVPPGFATTSDAFRTFLASNDLNAAINRELEALASGKITLQKAGKRIRTLILDGDWPDDLAAAIASQYGILGKAGNETDVPVAVRSSATAEDLPDASFAGQQETFLNVIGEAALLDACKRCYASLFTDRAISYRTIQGFAHDQVALSVGVQRMVRARPHIPRHCIPASASHSRLLGRTSAMRNLIGL